MKKFIDYLLCLLSHKLKLIGNYDICDEEKVRIGSVMTYKCERCGKIKMFPGSFVDF